MQQLPLIDGKWYATELIGDEFTEAGKASHSYSPIRIEAIEWTAKSRIVLSFFHANYPEGVQDKTYELDVIEHSTNFLLARSTTHKPTRYLLVYRITNQWLDDYFGGLRVDPSYVEILAAISSAKKSPHKLHQSTDKIMSKSKTANEKLMKNTWQVATAAEAFAAAQFARCGWDISVQYGANQPEYDLVAVGGDRTLKISVKGSKDGGWGLTQSHIKNADYQSAADAWLARHSEKTIICLVQFKDVQIDQLPRMYLARPSEIAAWLKAAAANRGDTILYERHVWTERTKTPGAAGTIDAIPDHWIFSESRIDELAPL